MGPPPRRSRWCAGRWPPFHTWRLPTCSARPRRSARIQRCCPTITAIPARAGSVGRALPGVEVRWSPRRGDAVEPGTVGELWVNTTQNVTEGWLHTGDLARQDSDGYIFPSGRLSDTINRGGEKFGPIEVEEALRSHPAVADVAVAGVADEELGQRVGAAVVTRAPVTLAELRSHCRDLIAYFKLPERLAVVDQIPYSATGKVSRHQIATLISET